MAHTTLSPTSIRSMLLPRGKEAHKGDFGHVLVLAGSPGMSGAAALCANAALRAGAGLVTAATAASEQKAVAAHTRPEAMTLGLPENRGGGLARNALGVLEKFIAMRRVTSMIMGPGLGSSQATVIVLRQLLMRLGLPLVVDADALRVLGSAGSIPRAQLILTPHPGEMATLAGIHKDDVQQNREAIARTVAKKFGAVCVLKGYHTVITDGDTLLINPTGNPGMATGGSGDVLAGMIAALVMQVKAPQLLHAAAAGVYLHGMAGDIAVRHTTQMSLLAGDITENLPAALHALRIR